jgi:hypothetical protein
MRHNEQNYDRDYRNQEHRSGDRHNLSNYLSRYEDSAGRQDRSHNYERERHTQGQMHQNEWGGSSRDSDRNRYSQHQSGSSQQGQYRYGDPNPYMDYQRQGGYERTRGTGWRSEDVDHANRRYDRQENSYRHTGHGRHIDQFGTDEHYNYSRNRQDGRRSLEDSESLDDRYVDRGEHRSSSSRSDYGQQYGSNYDHRNRDRQGRDDNYESGRYREQGSGRSREGGQFDHTSDDYPSRSPKGYGHKSGPDYSASSPITNYGPGVRGHQK